MSKPIEIKMPIRTVSEANQGGKLRTKIRRKMSQKRDFALLWRPNYTKQIKMPCRVTFTRYSCRLLDTDNLAGSMKVCRDTLAKILGVDDGDESKIKWCYEQERINKRENYFTVRIEF